MRVNDIFIILALLAIPIWQAFCAVAAASDDNRPEAQTPPQASVELKSVSALSILPKTVDNDAKSPVPIFELNLSRAEFDDETFAGNITLWGFTLALGLDSRYQVGYSYLTNTHLFGDWDPSLDEGPEIAGNEDFDISSSLIYLRRDWPIEGRLSGFALIGYSEVEIETHLLETCFFVCGELIKVSKGEITYDNQQSGISWGVGIQWQSGRFGGWTLRYVDQSSGDFEFRSIRLDLSIQG